MASPAGDEFHAAGPSYQTGAFVIAVLARKAGMARPAWAVY